MKKLRIRVIDMAEVAQVISKKSKTRILIFQIQSLYLLFLM